MGTLVSCQSISKQFGSTPLFADLSFGVEDGDRLGIVGPNGSGKSTLLKILTGDVPPDSGVVAARKGLRTAYVAQQAHFSRDMTVAGALEASMRAHGVPERQFAGVTSEVIGKVGFSSPEQPVDQLSGGWRKRLSIACALVTDPELVLLDEPTNHLDLAGIVWLERFLLAANFAFVVVSHDRYFLENTTNRVLEVNRVFPQSVFSVQGNYSQFLERRDDFLRGQAQYQASLANKVRREVEWLRQGAKARTTKQQARIQAAEGLQQELAEVKARTRPTGVSIDFSASERKTKKLVRLVKVNKAINDRPLFTNLNVTLSPGMRVGLLGLNASGKTTLLRIISGQLLPDSGVVETAEKLKIVYFEQNREALDPGITLRRTLAPEGDSVVTAQKTVHVAGWAKKFLFGPEQLDVPVGKLSGGEQARVLIARLMLQPADILLLDEPTNDLDIPTLEVLEESLGEFPGAVVLVTHDRFMLDRVSNVLLALDGRGKAEFFADMQQWLTQNVVARKKFAADSAVKPPASHVEELPGAVPAKKKLSYLEQREFDQMEAKIAAAEAAVAACQASLDDPSIANNSVRLQSAYNDLHAAQNLVESLYARWAELEAKIQ